VFSVLSVVKIPAKGPLKKVKKIVDFISEACDNPRSSRAKPQNNPRETRGVKHAEQNHNNHKTNPSEAKKAPQNNAERKT
jgi:hypothetical protein